MNRKKLVAGLLLFVFLGMTGTEVALASFIIQSREAVDIEVKGYNGLNEIILFKGRLSAGTKETVDTPYHGLGLLVFEKGQHYPVILGKQSFTLNMNNADKLPVFIGSSENEFFYKLLTDVEPGPVQYDFALLMIEAKELLDSSSSIHTVAELKAMKEKFHTFVRSHYQNLQHSDMLRRLIGQYFMMHEYVDYHIKGAPASDIQVRYKKAVIGGVGNWLEILKTHIPEHEIVNYCVSLYYNRGMVTLASRIIVNFRDVAYCPGDEKVKISFAKNLPMIKGNEKRAQRLDTCKNNKIIAFVSEDCPVSMVETVMKVRQLAAQKKNVTVIVAPLETLSDKHLAMRRMVSSGNMLFIDDDKWRKKNMPEKLKLPQFVHIEKEQAIEVTQ
jgi:hypothetical protein